MTSSSWGSHDVHTAKRESVRGREPPGRGEIPLPCRHRVRLGAPAQIKEIADRAGALKPDPENDSSFREVLGLIRRYEEAKDRRDKRLSNWWGAVRVVFLEGADKSLADEAGMYYDESQGEIRQILLQLSHREWTPEPEDTRHEMGQ